LTKKLVVVCMLLALATCAFAQVPANIRIMKPYHNGQLAPQAATITYNGGPIMNNGNTAMYFIYYGTFTAKDKQILNFWGQNIGASSLYAINTTYFDGSFVNIPAGIQFDPVANVYNDNYSLGKNLTDANVQTVVKNAITGGHLPDNPDGIYFVLTATDVHESAAFGTFCGTFCGYHGPSTSIISGETIKYSFVGNAASQCPSGCIGNVAVYGDTTSPNGDLGADGMASVIFHELSETVTDPEVNLHTAWAGSCSENGDCCNFVYGPTHTAPNGSHANVKIAGRAFLLQEMFKLTQHQLPTDTGVCAQK
jgi:hypothetical protein